MQMRIDSTLKRGQGVSSLETQLDSLICNLSFLQSELEEVLEENSIGGGGNGGDVAVRPQKIGRNDDGITIGEWLLYADNSERNNSSSYKTPLK